MAKSTKISTNRYPLRMTDDDMIKLVSELAASPHFSSKNDVLNSALKFGVPLLYKEIFGKRIATTGVLNPESTSKENQILVAKKLQEISLTTDDIFVVLNIIEYLVTTIYNVELAKINKVNITDDEIRAGLLSDLPDNLKRVKDEVINRYNYKEKK